MLDVVTAVAEVSVEKELMVPAWCVGVTELTSGVGHGDV